MTDQKSYIDADGEALPLDEQWFKEAKRGRPKSKNPKVPTSIRLDAEVLEKFKELHPDGWQTAMNDALRGVVGLEPANDRTGATKAGRA